MQQVRQSVAGGIAAWLALIGGLSIFDISLQHPNQAQYARHSETTDQESKKGSAEDRIAAYTWWLALFTGALVVVSGVQIRFLIRADRTAKISADAAKVSADGARRAAEALPKVERAYLFVGPTDIRDKVSTGTISASLKIENYGKTPGILKLIHGEFSRSEPQGEPIYSPAVTFVTDVALMAGTAIAQHRRREMGNHSPGLIP